MGVRGARFRGRIKIKGRPKEMARAEIMIMKQREEYESKKIKRIFYIFLDIIILLSFSLALYFTYFQDYTKTILFLSIGSLLLIFFMIKRSLKKREKR